MSTRVEKGAAKFRPIIKAKTRPSATPAPPDNESSEARISMPPPATIPIRTHSVTPSALQSAAENSPQLPLVEEPSVPKPSASQPVVIQPARPKPNTGNVISISRSRPQSTGAPIVPTRASQPPQPRAQIATPAAVASSQPSDSRQSPLASSAQPTPISTPIPSPSRGKKRAVEEFIADTPASGGEEAGITQKRPRLAILQEEGGQVKKRTPRRAASKKAIKESETTEGEEASGTESAPKRKRAPRKKRVTDENAESGEAVTEGEAPQPKFPRAKRKKSVQSTTTVEGDEDAEGSDDSETRAPKKRRRRAKTVEAPSQVGTPEPLDPTQVLMSTICDDLGTGRVSSRWESSQVMYAEAKKRAREERARAIVVAEEEERETGRSTGRKLPKPVLPGAKQGEGEESTVDNTGQNPDEFTYDETLKASQYAPQVRVGANGEVVLDVDSLQVDRAADENTEEYSHIEETDQSRFTNSNSWSKRRVVRWGKEDTALFYDALRQFGQNFDLIARVLPGRTYRMCKNKFKAEDKKNPALIDDALKNRVSVDMSTLSRMTGRDFSGPTPVIEAKKTLTLAEDEEQPTAAEAQTEGAEEAVESNPAPQPPAPAELAAAQRSPSPLAADDLLNTLSTSRQSASPPLLNPTPPQPESTAGQKGPSPIGPPKRIAVPVSAPKRFPSQSAAKPTSTPTPVPITVTKSRGRSKAKDDGVEIVGDIDEHLED